MYLAIDIGGTKTFVACLTDDGVITEQLRFETNKNYGQFRQNLASNVAKLSTKEFIACAVGVPGLLDRKNGVGLAMGNLPWKDVPIGPDIKEIVKCPVMIENDANLAGLSEAMLLKDKYSRVLYITISTGIGTGVIVNQAIDPAFEDSEGGHMLVERHDKLVAWESFASGKAIFKRYGQKAKDIEDPKIWEQVAHDLSVGMMDLIAVVQPEVIVIGGSVGHYLEKFQAPLTKILKRYRTPLVPIPPILEAKRPEEAVVYGCYDLARQKA